MYSVVEFALYNLRERDHKKVGIPCLVCSTIHSHAPATRKEGNATTERERRVRRKRSLLITIKTDKKRNWKTLFEEKNISHHLSPSLSHTHAHLSFLLPHLRPQPNILPLQPPILPLQPSDFLLLLPHLPLQLADAVAAAHGLQDPAQLVVEARVQRLVFGIGLAVQLVELAGFGLGDGERRGQVRVDGGDAGAGSFDLRGELGFEFEEALGQVGCVVVVALAAGWAGGSRGCEAGSADCAAATDGQGFGADGAGAGWGRGQLVADQEELVLDVVLGGGEVGLLVLQAFAELLRRLHAELFGLRRQR